MSETIPDKCAVIADQEAEINRLLAIVLDACEVLEHYDLPEHAFHYRRVLAKEVALNAPKKPGDK